MQAFNGFSIVPPGIGIVHQVNLEYLARGVLESMGFITPIRWWERIHTPR